jgi:transposase
MFLRRITVHKDGKPHQYWALAESYRTERGPRQRIVCYLGDVAAGDAKAVAHAVERVESCQQDFLSPEELPSHLDIDPRQVRTERARAFGGVWLGKKLYELLRLNELFGELLSERRCGVAWDKIVEVLVISRFYNPSSELHLAEHIYQTGAFEDLLGVPAEKVYENRLYRCLDKVLPHKNRLEQHLKSRLGELFHIEYELFLYDVTSTYFEGRCGGSTLAQRGYSRDSRPDCPQVCIALVVTKEGLPLGYEVFAGNRSDSTTVEEIVNAMERTYGRCDRIWVMDRGMASAENIAYLHQHGRRFIIGAAKSALKKVEQQLLKEDWRQVEAGVEVKMCPNPDNAMETYILCRSRERAAKERAMFERFVKRIEEGLEKICASCRSHRGTDLSARIERRIGRLLERNSRAASLFDIHVAYDSSSGSTTVCWMTKEHVRQWAHLSEGHYLLRTNIQDWSAPDLWKAYIHLTDAEDAFRIHKSDLSLRPVWHQKDDRILAHIFICFLAFVLWKCFAQICKSKGLGDESRRIIEEIGAIQMVDVVLATSLGKELKLRTITRPDRRVQELLSRLGWRLPDTVTKPKM